ncbi:MAG: DEAD/DEAH box helicase [Anaerolineae bacterium]|nr:DEAD/DEAH box helicase [Anaerolineae bacterium]
MADNPFYRLAPFIQEYIYRQKWASLRAVQVKAMAAIMDTPNHVLIQSSTASGKTEAALLPIITQLYEDPPSTIGAMYIGPLKALINDQFERITGLLEETDIPIQSWHGDVSQTKKTRFLRRAQGILQITPESLEAMLINRHHELGRLFSDLRFVIIDEIHAFIDSDRGRQVICQLERLAQIQSTPARRIGLSATIGEPQLAIEWLAGNTGTPVNLIEGTNDSNIQLGMEYFLLPDADDDDDDDDDAATNGDNKADDSFEENVESDLDTASLLEETTVFYEHLHKMTQSASKTLIFANRRSDTEEITSNLRQLSERKRLPSFYYVHHGSISAALRESAETAMRDPTQKACVAATITLELGIDIGQLDQVLQVNSTHSVSSFVQRLGRSGRRGDPSRLFFYCMETNEKPKHIGDQLPWGLLQAIAIVQLYLEEKWIEPPTIPDLPLSLLYHQTMSTITSHTELLPPQLAERVLSLSPFQKVTQDHYRTLLRHLLQINHLEQTDIGGLIIGLEAEKIVNNYHFYATFEDEIAYRVRNQSREIGTIQAVPQIGSTIGLAGYAWQVQDVNYEQKTVFVTAAKGKVKTLWTGGGVQIHTRIVQKIRDILLTNVEYTYLHTRAKKRLEIARHNIHKWGLSESSILPLAPHRYIVFPWCGTRQFETQLLFLSKTNLTVKNHLSPFYYEIDCNEKDSTLLTTNLRQLIETPPTNFDLVKAIDGNDLLHNKYDKYIPEELLREAHARNFIDIDGSISSLEQIIS